MIVGPVQGCSGGDATASSETANTAEPATCGPFPQAMGNIELTGGARVDQAPVTQEQAQAFVAADGLQLEVAPPRVDASTHEVTVTGTLRNTGQTEASVVYLTGGAMFTSTNPFNVAVEARPLPFDAPSGPEVYPAPARVFLPPGAEVRFPVRVCADLYEHTPGERVRLRWSFQYWTEPHPSGEVFVELP